MKNHFKTFASFFGFLVTALIFGLLMHGTLAAWTAPAEAPPDGNVFAPINVGDDSSQAKGEGIGATIFFDSIAPGYLLDLNQSSFLSSLQLESGLTLDSILGCNALETDGSGNIFCGTDAVGADQNLFATVIAGATSLVANLTADTLTIVGGTGIDISGVAGTNTLTITNAGDTDASDDITTLTGTDPISISGAGNTRNVALAACPTADDILKWNGSSWVCQPDAGGSVDGSGGAGQVAFWSAASTLAGDSLFSWDNINNRLGIGTSSPDTSLELSAATDSLLRLTRSGATNPTTFRVGTDSAMVIQNDAVDTLFLNNGDVGVGVTPSYDLDVSGQINMSSNLRIGGNIVINSGREFEGLIDNVTIDVASAPVGRIWLCVDTGDSTPCNGI